MQDRPGWYADPSGGLDRFRWWDGGSWTRWLSRSPAAGAPPETSTTVSPVEPGPADPPTDSADPTDPPREPDGTVKLPVAVAITLATLVLALIAVGAVASLNTDKLPTGPAIPPPTPTGASVYVDYDVKSGHVAIGELSLTVPQAPFTCDPQPGPYIPSFESVLTCEAVVHHAYDAKGNDWEALTGIGTLKTSAVTADDLAATTERAFDKVVALYYAPKLVTVKKRQRNKLVHIAPDGKAMVVTGQLHYSIKGLSSTYDDALVAVFQLKSGSYAAYFSLRPNDTPAATKKVQNTAADTVQALG